MCKNTSKIKCERFIKISSIYAHCHAWAGRTIRQAETELERESRGWLEILFWWVLVGGGWGFAHEKMLLKINQSIIECLQQENHIHRCRITQFLRFYPF